MIAIDAHVTVGDAVTVLRLRDSLPHRGTLILNRALRRIHNRYNRDNCDEFTRTTTAGVVLADCCTLRKLLTIFGDRGSIGPRTGTREGHTEIELQERVLKVGGKYPAIARITVRYSGCCSIVPGNAVVAPVKQARVTPCVDAIICAHPVDAVDGLRTRG